MCVCVCVCVCGNSNIIIIVSMAKILHFTNVVLSIYFLPSVLPRLSPDIILCG